MLILGLNVPQTSLQVLWDPPMSILYTWSSERQCPGYLRWIMTAVLSCMQQPPIAQRPVISLSLFFLHYVVGEQWPLRSQLFQSPFPRSNHKVWSPAHPIIPLSCFLYQRERTWGGYMNIKCVFWSTDTSRVWNCGALRLEEETTGKASWMEGCSFNSVSETRLKKTEHWCTAYVQRPVHYSTRYLWYYYWDVTATVTLNRSPVSYFITLFLIKACVLLKEQFTKDWSFPPSKRIQKYRKVVHLTYSAIFKAFWIHMIALGEK